MTNEEAIVQLEIDATNLVGRLASEPVHDTSFSELWKRKLEAIDIAIYAIKMFDKHEAECERCACNLLAERDGRCVVLPCRVGDTVYYPYAGRVIPKRITQYREILRKSEAIDRWYCLEFSNDETFDAEDIGNTVFLTRAEAEAAIAKEADNAD